MKKRFGGNEVLRQVDIEVSDQEFFTLVGPSGCGKSTLLNLVAGLEVPSDGAILFDGQEVTAWGPRQRDVAMVFQNYALYPHMRVRQNLAFPLAVRRLEADRIAGEVDRIARLLGLEQLLDRFPRELSGGQQQRVALGRALIRSPRVFLMDEPLSNLDAKLRTLMRLELKRLHQDVPVTTVYVTHDQEEAMSLSDRLAILKDGVLQQVGSPQQVYDRPANAFVAQFIGKPPMNVLPAKLDAGGITVGDTTLPFPSERLGELRSALSPQPAIRNPQPAVLLGIRPEHLQLAPESPVKGKVLVVETLGSETWVELRWEGLDLVLKTLEFGGRPGDCVGMRFPPERLHFFHPEAQDRIAA